MFLMEKLQNAKKRIDMKLWENVERSSRQSIPRNIKRLVLGQEIKPRGIRNWSLLLLQVKVIGLMIPT
jgi:hypothetical protein